MCDGGKKLLNDVDRCVDECLAGLVAAHPTLLTLHPQHRVIIAKVSVASVKGHSNLFSDKKNGDLL